MRLEIFSAGKPKVDPGINEDLFLALPGFGFAVVDGLSDRTGHRYGGLSAGQMAARLVCAEVASWLVASRHDEPSTLIERLTTRVRKAYDDNGIADVAMAEPGRRFGATLALAIDLGKSWRFVLVGDSGIRLNGREILQNDHPVDVVTSRLRIEAYLAAQARGADDETAASIARAVSFNGPIHLHAEMHPWLGKDDLPVILAKARADATRLLPHVPAADIDLLLTKGIVHGQGHFQNNTSSPMSYAVIDGTPVPMAHIAVVERPAGEIATIELFTDGYVQRQTEVASLHGSQLCCNRSPGPGQDRRVSLPEARRRSLVRRSDDRRGQCRPAELAASLPADA
ncbi:MAG: protein phosphatase 2C domain-containing protein [Geminicoccaceae bacterium]